MTDTHGNSMQNATLRIPVIMAPMMAPCVVTQDASPIQSPVSPWSSISGEPVHSEFSPWSSSSEESVWSAFSSLTSSSKEPTETGSVSPSEEPVAQKQAKISQFQTSEWRPKDVKWAVSQLKGNDPIARDSVMQEVLNHAWSMANMRHGCLVVQKALEVASAETRMELAKLFKGHVWEALLSPHANHVMQCCITLLMPDEVTFIYEELKDHVGDAARHRFGCRILQKLLEKTTIEQTDAIVNEIISDLYGLCRDVYGNYVVQHIIEKGLPQHRQRITATIWPQVRYLAQHKIGSFVVQSLILHNFNEHEENRAEYSEVLTSLQHSQYGSFVAKSVKKNGVAETSVPASHSGKHCQNSVR